MEEKKALKTQVETGWSQLEADKMRRKTVEKDVAWLLWKGIVHVVDKVVESAEFYLEVRHMKANTWLMGWRVEKGD